MTDSERLKILLGIIKRLVLPETVRRPVEKTTELVRVELPSKIKPPEEDRALPDSTMAWIDHAIDVGHGICNTGAWKGIMYLSPSALDPYIVKSDDPRKPDKVVKPAELVPSWVFVPNDMSKEQAKKMLILAFEHLLGKSDES
jgi:hypothetical protein